MIKNYFFGLKYQLAVSSLLNYQRISLNSEFLNSLFQDGSFDTHCTGSRSTFPSQVNLSGPGHWVNKADTQ